jgi:hypothetical protein
MVPLHSSAEQRGRPAYAQVTKLPSLPADAVERASVPAGLDGDPTAFWTRGHGGPLYGVRG